MAKPVACILYGQFGALMDPPGGEQVLTEKFAAAGFDTARSPYNCDDVKGVYDALHAGRLAGARLVLGGDSLGANNAPYYAKIFSWPIDYLFGFQPSFWGAHAQVPKNVLYARCIFNPNPFSTFPLIDFGSYEWDLAPGNTVTKLRKSPTNDFHPGDDDELMQQLVLAEAKKYCF